MQLPPGKTIDDVLAVFGVLAATPTAAPPEWFLAATFAGSPGFVDPGGEAQAVVDLAPGTYVVLPDEGSQPPRQLVVEASAGGTPPVSPAPAAQVTVTEREFGFAGLDGPVPAGTSGRSRTPAPSRTRC